MERKTKIDFAESVKSFKTIMDNFMELLKDIKKLKNEDQGNAPEKPSVSFNPNNFLDMYAKPTERVNEENKDTGSIVDREADSNPLSTKRKLTKNLIRKVSSKKHSSVLLNNLWSNMQRRKFGSFAEINEDNVIMNSNADRDENHKVKFSEKSNEHDKDESNQNIQNQVSLFKEDKEPDVKFKSPKENLDNIDSEEESDKSEEPRVQHKIQSNKLLKKIRGGPRYSILENNQKGTNPLTPASIIQGKYGKNRQSEFHQYEDFRRKNFRASIISHGSFLLGDENIQEIKQLKIENSMYKNQIELLTAKLKDIETIRKELKKMLPLYEQKNEEIYKSELNNLHLCFEIYRGYYEEELSSRKEIIDELSKIIEDMKLK